ncbi:MAG: T9SS type A sorting domain-containing protein [Candidatus Nanoarchaeia archaeon]
MVGWLKDKFKFYTGVALLSLSSLFAEAQTTINVNGNVKNQFGTNQENVKAIFFDNSTNIKVDSAYTNELGNYNKNFVWTGNSSETLELKINAYPNPYSSSTNIQIATPKNDNYILKVFDIQSRTLMNLELYLNQGINTITLNGGNKGINIIVLENETERKTYKTIQLENTGVPLSAHVSTSSNAPEYKSTLDGITDGAEMRIEFHKDGYQLKDTTFIVHLENTIDQIIQQNPYIFTATLKPYLDDGTPVTTLAPGWSTTIEFPAPTGTKTYTPNSNNEIIIQEELYPQNGELGNVIMQHDTSDYFVNGTNNGVLSWIVLRTQNQSTKIRNVAQSESTELLPEATTTVSLDSLNGKTLNYYMLPKKAETQPGTWFNLNDARGWMASSGGGAQSGKFIEVPPYGHVVLMKTVYDDEPTKFPTQANMDRAINEYTQAINLCDMLNNDNISLPTQFFYTNMNDSIWNAVQARTPLMDNTLVLTFKTGSPGVIRGWIDTYTYDGELRLNYSKAKYSESATNGQIFTENYSATFGITEGSGSLGPYVYSSTGEPTDLAGHMGRWVKLLDLGSGSAKSSTSSTPKPKQLFSTATLGEAPVYFNDATTFYSSFSNPEYDYTNTGK